MGDAVLDVIRALPSWPRAIGGLTHGADPIVGSVMMRAHAEGLHLDGFYVRKEPKKHGTKNRIENAPEPGSEVVVVDDVVTGGGSVINAINAIREAGCQVSAVITLVDRLEGGGDNVRKLVGTYFPLFTLEDFRREIDSCQTNLNSFETFSTRVSA